MKVFLDTNIIIDFYDKRGEFSRDLLIMCRLQMNSWKQFSITNRKARQDFDGLGELFFFYFPNLEVSTSSAAWPCSRRNDR